MSPIPIYAESIAVVAPGLGDWAESVALLRNPSCRGARELPSDALSLAEPASTCPACQAVEHLARRSSLDLSRTVPLFEGSSNSLPVIDRVCYALIPLARPASPAARSRGAPTVSPSPATRALSPSPVTARHATFAAGLLEAFAHFASNDVPLLLVCYDHPGTPRSDQYRPTLAPVAVAMVLTREPPASYCCSLQAELVAEAPETRIEPPALERLRVTNPSARALPVLRAVAAGSASRVYLSAGQMSLAVDVAPPALPRRIGANEIYARIPHSGAMRLLDAVLFWDEKSIHCSATSHADRGNPLGVRGILRNVHALEYAAQAIAVHGSLLRSSNDPMNGAAALKLVYVGSFRDVNMMSATIGETDGAPLDIRAEQYAAVPGGWSYGFLVAAGGATMARGKATVVVPEAAT